MAYFSYDRSYRIPFTGALGPDSIQLIDKASRQGQNWSSDTAPPDELHTCHTEMRLVSLPAVDVAIRRNVFLYWKWVNGHKYAVYGVQETPGRASMSSVGIGVSYPSNYPPNVESRLNAKLAAKLRDAASSVIVTAGEAGETVYMLRDAVRRLVGFCWSLYKKQWRAAARYLFPRVPSSTIYYHARKFRHLHSKSKSHRVSYAKTILEYEFGWRPLASDVDALSKSLSSLLFRSRPVKVKAKVESKYEMVINLAKASNNRLGRIDRKTLWVEAAIPPLATLGLTFPDLIAALYNLTPFSFAADWAWNLNSYLEAWATKTQVKPICTQHSFKETVSVSGFHSPSNASELDRWYFKSDNGTSYSTVIYDRGKPSPGWDLALPPITLEHMTSIRHLMDTLALAREKFRNISFHS